MPRKVNYGLDYDDDYDTYNDYDDYQYEHEVEEDGYDYDHNVKGDCKWHLYFSFSPVGVFFQSDLFILSSLVIFIFYHDLCNKQITILSKVNSPSFLA